MAAYDFTMDWTPLGKLGEIYQQSQQRQQLQEGLQKMGLPGNMNLAQLFMQQQAAQRGESRDARDFGFRQQESTRAQSNADRSFGLQQQQFTAGIEGAKMQPGFEKDPNTGGVRPVKGGTADPDYIHRVTEAKDKGKQFNAGEITKLVEEGGKFSNLANFSATFQDRFAGYAVPGVGNAAMAAGRFVPGMVGKLPGMNEADIREGAQWWQGYDRYKNQVRNDLFGSALTVNEQAAFERADIGPGMDPAQIKVNLEAQTKILKDAMKRKAGALVAGGYQAEPIAKAYGLKLEDIGVEPRKSPGGSTRPPDTAIQALRAQPALREQFDAKYGAGMAARILGGP